MCNIFAYSEALIIVVTIIFYNCGSLDLVLGPKPISPAKNILSIQFQRKFIWNPIFNLSIIKVKLKLLTEYRFSYTKYNFNLEDFYRNVPNFFTLLYPAQHVHSKPCYLTTLYHVKWWKTSKTWTTFEDKFLCPELSFVHFY